MTLTIRWRWVILLAAIGLGAEAVLVIMAERPRGNSERLAGVMDTLRPLHRRLGKPQPGDWLVSHPEPGQTFAQYLRANPVVPTQERRAIYIQPLGDFSDKQRDVVALAADFIGRYYGLAVASLPPLPLSIIPADARRTHPSWGDKQILTSFVLDKVLPPRLPKDAFACIAFTASDLWPGPGWNFVFGQASLRERVGVWSIYRFGDPAAGEAEFARCLRRTAATGVHELGHMFSMRHCTAYECLMCGSNNMGESDRRPVEFCPECLAKACWATGFDPLKRFVSLEKFCVEHGLKAEADFYAKCIQALGGPGDVSSSQPASAPGGPA